MELELSELDRFELLDSIARGATGQVFEGRDRSDPSGALCAIKVIDAKLAEGARFATILNAEAPQAVAFRHESAARTLFAGKSGRHTIIATERMRGHTLDAWIQRVAVAPKPPPWELIAWIGLQVVQVLHAAHQTPWAEGESKGMYHCSISPHSIFLLPTGQVRVLGVGLGRSRMCLPPSRHKLPYRAPELFERQKPDELTDIYSLGVTLYDALSGSRFYGRDSVGDIKDAILGETPPSLRMERPELETGIDEMITEMMSKFPRTRPSLKKVEETLSLLSRRSAFSSGALASTLEELFGIDKGNGRIGRNGARAAIEDPNGFYPEYDIEDLVEKLMSSKIAESPQVQPEIYQSVPLVPLAEMVSTVPVPPVAPVGLDSIDDSGDINPFDVDAIVNAIVSGAKTSDIERNMTPPPRPPPIAPPVKPQRIKRLSNEEFYAGALASLEDPEGSFDVDAVVKAIVTSKPGEIDQMVTLPNVVEPPKTGPAPAPLKTPRQIIDDNTEPLRGDITPPEVLGTSDVMVGAEALKAGDVISDRYRVIDELGEGGMSVVYRVEHTLLLKQMALKLLRPELSSLPAVVERFQLEARSVCQLDDPNIVRVTDFGRQPNGSLYLVMDYLEGESLAAKLRRETKLNLAEAVDVTLQILSGLAHAHRFGVVHRDLKPENIMLVPKYERIQVKILDFGIAKLAARDHSDSAKPITQAGTVFGTPRYMSPEQASAEPVDLRADLYAVGVILYEALSGEPPFDGPSAVKILSKVLTEEPPPLNLMQPDRRTGLEIEAVVMRALQKEKEDRFSSADTFRAALVKAAAGR